MSAFKYRIRYERFSNGTPWIPCVSDVYGVSAAGALHSFHRWMQLSKELDGDKKVIRQMLGPNEYRLTGIAQIYSSAASGKIGAEMIESKFDLPTNPTNPDLREKKQPAEEATMGFMNNLPEGKLAT